VSYKSATSQLPAELLIEIQKYVQGERIYIPKCDDVKRTWGERNGTREAINFRNKEILAQYKMGIDFEHLSELFCLSTETIRKIIYKQRKE
jgi:Mor family transcriptional regulator